MGYVDDSMRTFIGMQFHQNMDKGWKEWPKVSVINIISTQVAMKGDILIFLTESDPLSNKRCIGITMYVQDFFLTVMKGVLVFYDTR